MDAFVPASLPSVIAFLVVVVTVLAAILAMVYRAYRSTAAVVGVGVALVVWLAAQGAVVLTGRMTSLPQNGLPFFFGSIAIVWIGIGFSPVGGRLAVMVPMSALVAFQAFRLPLELVLHSWVLQGTIPDTMTWTGQNWDIVTGVLALVCAPFAGQVRALAWLVNVVGAALLLNVIRVAMLSAPVSFGWHVAPPLLVAFHLPYALIGPVCVGGALFGHIVLTRALFAGSATSAE